MSKDHKSIRGPGATWQREADYQRSGRGRPPGLIFRFRRSNAQCSTGVHPPKSGRRPDSFSPLQESRARTCAFLKELRREEPLKGLKQLLDLIRLTDEIIRPKPFGFHCVCKITVRREHDDLDMGRLFFDMSQDAKSIERGHHDIKHS